MGRALTRHGPHTISAKNSELHKGLNSYMVKKKEHKGALFELFGYKASKKLDSEASKTNFIKKVLIQGLGLGSETLKSPRDTVVIDAKAFFNLQNTYHVFTFYERQECGAFEVDGVDDV